MSAWGEKAAAPPFRLSTDTTSDLCDQVRASRLAQPENTFLLANASRAMAALTSAVALRKSREDIQREALACMCWLARVVEEGADAMTNHTLASWAERELEAAERLARHMREERRRRRKVALVSLGLALATMGALVAFLASQAGGR